MDRSAVLGLESESSAGDNSDSSVRLENPLTQTDWDARVSGQSGISFFHSAAWAAVLQRTYGFTPVYFTSTRGNELLSLLPVMEVNSWFTGRRGVSLPFTDFCEPIGSAPSALRAVIREALRHGQARRWKYLEFRARPQVELFDTAPSSLSFLDHQLELRSDTSSLFAGFESSVRRAIRKAQNSGLEVEIAQSLPATREYYVLHCHTRKQHGLPPQPYRFFLNIYRHVLSQNLGMVVSAKYSGRTIASAMFFHSGSEAIYKFGASDPAFQELRANNLVMWEAIQWCARNGKRLLHFGRTSLGHEGLRRYKLGWGARESSMNYFKFDLRKGAFISDKDETVGWHNRIFRAMPIFLNRMVGAALYKHVA